MSLRTPTFNLTCNIYPWTGSGTLPAPRLTGVPCNLAQGRRSYPGNLTSNSGVAQLLLPKGTDVRDTLSVAAGQFDFVEVPAGSGRVYVVGLADDVGKGFPNEYRVAIILKTRQFGNWPAPMP